MVMYGSGMSDSNQHNPKNVPTLLVSGKDFGLKGNRSLFFPDATPLANLQLTVAERFGIPVETFGDSNGRVEGFFA